LIRITGSSPAKSYIEYTLMTPLIYQYVIVFWSFLPPLSHLIFLTFAKTIPPSLLLWLLSYLNAEGSHFLTAESHVPFPLFASHQNIKVRVYVKWSVTEKLY
jgi:hypothetical protein